MLMLLLLVCELHSAAPLLLFSLIQYLSLAITNAGITDSSNLIKEEANLFLDNRH